MSQRRTTSGRRGGVREERPWPVGTLVVGSIVLTFLVAFVVVVVLDVRDKAGSTAPSGVRSYSSLSRTHTDELVNYPQSPPVGGPHNPAWQDCGFYSEPVRIENAVHSMEHGAAWITYRGGLPAAQVEKIRNLADQSYVLASPYPNLPAPVVASAWGKQLRLDSAGDPSLDRFVNTYSQGPQTPEPGAACTGGIGPQG